MARNNHRILPSDKHRDRIPARFRSSRHGTVANPARPVLGSQPPNLSGSFRIGNRRQSSCCCELLCYFFLNLSKIDISENLRFLGRSFSASCVLTCPVESKPNSRMIKKKTIGVVLMASSIIDKKSPPRECRPGLAFPGPFFDGVLRRGGTNRKSIFRR